MRITSYSVEIKDSLNILVREETVIYETKPLSNPEVITEMMNTVFRLKQKAEEHVYILALNTKYRPVGVFLLTKGTVDSSLVSPREIFVRMFLCGASRFVMIHNHPSGDPCPSSEDIIMTRRLKECCQLMNVKLLDHIIIADDGYYSFDDRGIL